MESLSDALETMNLSCRISHSEGLMSIARREDTISSSKGLRILFGMGLGQILLWSGRQYYFPIERLSPTWIKSLIDQPESSYLCGVLKSLDQDLNLEMGLKSCDVYHIHGDSVRGIVTRGNANPRLRISNLSPTTI